MVYQVLIYIERLLLIYTINIFDNNFILFGFVIDFENNQTAAAMPKQSNVVPYLNPKVLANKCNLRPSLSYNKFPGQKIPANDLR